ncbi:MAG TPA: response regulator [Polyangia bacterium]|nr:response regulator [Polyangia bacterium]
MSTDRRPVLIVEDHRSIREGLSALLVAKGFPVVAAASGEEALKLLDNCLPSVLLLDLMLPGISGEELLATMRKDVRFVDMPVVVVSAAPVTLTNVTAVVRKPPNVDRLLETVSRIYSEKDPERVL